MSYAKIAMTTWGPGEPTKSCVAGTDREYAYEFEHELGCPTQGSTQDCTCYVSRIRLVKTPVGRMIPTTEPDLRESLTYWKHRAESWSREAERLRRTINLGLIGAGILAAANLIYVFGVLR